MEIWDLSLLELRVVLEASKAQSLRELGRVLLLKPAHLSKILARAEAKIGIELFRRSPQGVTLTPEARRILPALDDIHRSALRLAGTQVGGEVRTLNRPRPVCTIAGLSFLMSYLVGDALEGLAVAPEGRTLRYRTLNASPIELQRHALLGNIDVAIHLDPIEWPKRWESDVVGSLRWGLFAAIDHPLHARPKLLSRDLLEWGFIVPVYLAEEGFLPGRDQCPLPLESRALSHETETAAMAARLVATTADLSYLPVAVAHEGVAAGQLRELRVGDWPLVEKSVYLSVRTDRVKVRWLRAMRQRLAASLAQFLSV